MSLSRFRRAVSRSPSREHGRSRSQDSSPSGSRRDSFTNLLITGRRSASPFPAALANDYDDIPIRVGPQGFSVTDSESDVTDDDSADSELEFSDEETNANTEKNALLPDIDAEEEEHQDPLGEGINIVYEAEPHFTQAPTRRRSRKGESGHARPPLTTAPARFTRDCCTVTVTQGHPSKVLLESQRKHKTYLVCSDMSSESKFALDWAIGMVLRDGDILVVATVIETDSKVDSTDGTVDNVAKLANQRERESHAFALSRQVVTMLQRTRLNVTVVCQAWHAKNMRHHILDLVDLVEPVMLIIGSRGLGELKGILLGSTSHYLVQKSSVPVMVARRRLKRPARHSAHLEHRARVPLAKAAVEKEATHSQRPITEEDSVAAEDVDREAPAPEDESEDAPERGRRPVRFA